MAVMFSGDVSVSEDEGSSTQVKSNQVKSSKTMLHPIMEITNMVLKYKII